LLSPPNNSSGVASRILRQFSKRKNDTCFGKNVKKEFGPLTDENQIEEINKEEYEEVKNFIRINKKDPATQRRISTHIISIIIDEIINIINNTETE